MSGKYFMMIICALQLLATIERQVFNFLGYMWTPIICDFLLIIIVILCLFGVYQSRAYFVLIYSVFGVFWLSWNIFVICFYLNVGRIDRNRDAYIMNLSTGGKSWWLENGIGCQVIRNYTLAASSSGRGAPPESSVHSCIMSYYSVEVVHAAIQCFLVAIGVAISTFIFYQLRFEDATSLQVHNDELEYVKMRYKSPSRSPHPDIYNYHNFNAPHIAAVNSAFDTISIDEQPPSYSATVPDIATPTLDRRSMRSARSTRSARSGRSARSARSQRLKTGSNQEPTSERDRTRNVHRPPSVTNSVSNHVNTQNAVHNNYYGNAYDKGGHSHSKGSNAYSRSHSQYDSGDSPHESNPSVFRFPNQNHISSRHTPKLSPTTALQMRNVSSPVRPEHLPVMTTPTIPSRHILNQSTDREPHARQSGRHTPTNRHSRPRLADTPSSKHSERHTIHERLHSHSPEIEPSFPEPPPVRQSLPWIQITPTPNYNEIHFPGYDSHFV